MGFAKFCESSSEIVVFVLYISRRMGHSPKMSGATRRTNDESEVDSLPDLVLVRRGSRPGPTGQASSQVGPFVARPSLTGPGFFLAWLAVLGPARPDIVLKSGKHGFQSTFVA